MTGRTGGRGCGLAEIAFLPPEGGAPDRVRGGVPAGAGSAAFTLPPAEPPRPYALSGIANPLNLPTLLPDMPCRT
jgi:hypothetical protein